MIQQEHKGAGYKVGEVFEIAGDVTDPKTSVTLVDKAVKQRGKLDIFVANAGVFKEAKFLEIQPSLLVHSLDVKVEDTFYSCQAAARQMVKQGHGGPIIGVSSASALVGGSFQTHYTPTKAAILSMMKPMAISLGNDKIRCNALLPGTVSTQLVAHDMANPTKTAMLEARICSTISKLGTVNQLNRLDHPCIHLNQLVRMRKLRDLT